MNYLIDPHEILFVTHDFPETYIRTNLRESISFHVPLQTFTTLKLPNFQTIDGEGREGKGREGKGNCRRAAIFQARSNEPASNRRGNDRDNKWNPLIGRRFIIPLAPREPSARGRERASYPSRRPNWPFNERTNEQTNKQRLSSLVLSPLLPSSLLLPLSPHRSMQGGGRRRACIWRRRFRQRSTLHSTLTKL